MGGVKLTGLVVHLARGRDPVAWVSGSRSDGLADRAARFDSRSSDEIPRPAVRGHERAQALTPLTAMTRPRNGSHRASGGDDVGRVEVYGRAAAAERRGADFWPRSDRVN
jgi:hypothetical protein